MAANEFIVDFPLQRRNHVRFAETSLLHIVDRHEDDDHKKELWYTKAEYNSMKRSIKRDILRGRANDSASKDGLWIGIAHLLTPDSMLEVQACRCRCMRAVLAEQARLGSSASSRCEDIALASLAESRKAVLRARNLGKLHRDAV